MRVYVAGASAEVELVRVYMNQLRAAGIVITHDWTKSVIAAREAGRGNADLTVEERRAHAKADAISVRKADVVWLIAPDAPTINAWVELGLALGDLRTTIVSGRGALGCIFAASADREFATHDEALQHILGLRK